MADLSASSDNAYCPLYYSIERDSPSQGSDVMAHQWPLGLLYAFPPVQPSAQPAAEDQSGGDLSDPGGARLAPYDVVLVGDTTLGWDTMEAPSSPGPVEAGTRDPVPSLSSGAQSLSLATERAILLDMGLTGSAVRSSPINKGQRTLIARSCLCRGAMLTGSM